MGDQHGEVSESVNSSGTEAIPPPTSFADPFEATAPRSPLHDPTLLDGSSEGDNSVEYNTDSEDEKPLGAPFPSRLLVAHRWDIGVKLYEHMKFLLDWIEKRLEDDPDGTGEEFMCSGGSSMKFTSIWPDFFLRMVESESNGMIERLQYGLKVKKDANRIHQCLHFTYGEVRSSFRFTMYSFMIVHPSIS